MESFEPKNHPGFEKWNVDVRMEDTSQCQAAFGEGSSLSITLENCISDWEQKGFN